MVEVYEKPIDQYVVQSFCWKMPVFGEAEFVSIRIHKLSVINLVCQTGGGFQSPQLSVCSMVIIGSHKQEGKKRRKYIKVVPNPNKIINAARYYASEGKTSLQNASVGSRFCVT